MYRKKHLVGLVTAAWLFVFPAVALSAGVVVLPRTGQIACYDANGNFTACTDTGQDGDIQAGAVWPEPRFTDHSDGTVTDNLTGLMWTKDANHSGSYMSWLAALDYVKTLSTGGHTDWRLPNVNELESLVDVRSSAPALPAGHPFINPQAYGYWTSTTLANNLAMAWFVDMDTGIVDFSQNYKSFTYYVWPVRSSGHAGAIAIPRTGQTLCYYDNGTEIACAGTRQDGDIQAGAAWPSPRFVVEADNKTVTDGVTGLVWTKNANIMPSLDPGWDQDGDIDYGDVTWQHSLDYVIKLNNESYLGYTDWRLPNRKELRSLIDYSVANRIVPYASPFGSLQHFYWSSTTRLDFFDPIAWDIDTDEGSIKGGLKTNNQYVWPVRGGYVNGSPVTSTMPSTSTTSVSPTTTSTESSSTTSITPATTTVLGGSTTTTFSVTTTVFATTTTTTPSKPCPAQKVLGEDNPKLENLRNFRDSKLANSAVGRKIIQLYYANVDSINAALERSPALQAAARRLLAVIAPMLGR